MKSRLWIKKLMWIALIAQSIIILVLLVNMRRNMIYKTYNPMMTTYMKSDLLDNKKPLIGYWSFDDFNLDYVKDDSGNGHDGYFLSQFNMIFPKEILSNILDYNYAFGVPKKVEGKISNAVELNGRQWCSVGNYLKYNTDKFTISVWVMRSGEDDSYVPTIMAKGAWPFYDGWWLTTKPNSRFIDMGIAWGEDYVHIESGYEMPSDEWHHIAVTMDNEAHEIQFFIDGKLFGNKHENVPQWLINWNHDLLIGDFDGSGRWPWLGKIDEAHFFSGILDENKIMQLYKKAM